MIQGYGGTEPSATPASWRPASRCSSSPRLLPLNLVCANDANRANCANLF
jgi:hypothetical protein